MTRWILSALLLCSATAALAVPDVAGNWVVQDGSAVIAIEPCGRNMCGRIAKALIRKPNYPQTDIHNPDPAMRRTPLIGLRILSDFAPASDRWDNGRIYDPESGKSYRSVLKINADRSLKVSGCVFFICRSQRWTRAP